MKKLLRNILCKFGWHDWRLNKAYFKPIVRIPISPDFGYVNCQKTKDFNYKAF